MCCIYFCEVLWLDVMRWLQTCCIYFCEVLWLDVMRFYWHAYILQLCWENLTCDVFFQRFWDFAEIVFLLFCNVCCWRYQGICDDIALWLIVSSQSINACCTLVTIHKTSWRTVVSQRSRFAWRYHFSSQTDSGCAIFSDETCTNNDIY